MKRKTEASVSEAVSYIFQSGYFGRSEYIIPREMQLSIEEPESAFGNTDGFEEEECFLRMRDFPCFDGMEESAVREILARRIFHIACGKSDVTLAALESVCELRQKYGIRKFLLLADGTADRERLYRTMSVMQHHFSDRYYGLKLNILTYDSEDLRQIRTFALSDDIEILIINKEYFIRSNNLMRRPFDRFGGLSPAAMIGPARCVALTVSERIGDVRSILRHVYLFDPLCTVSFTENSDTLPDVPLVDRRVLGIRTAPEKDSESDPVFDTYQIGIE